MKTNTAPLPASAQEMPSPVVEFIEGLAARQGRSPADLLAEAFGLSLVAIDATAARRFREIERAADLEGGSFLESLLGWSSDWWTIEDATLEDWIEQGWQIESPDLMKANLAALRSKWAAEDAGKGEPDEAELSDGAAYAATLARIVEADRATNERAKALAGRRSTVLHLDVELVERMSAHLAGSGETLSDFIERELRKILPA